MAKFRPQACTQGGARYKTVALWWGPLTLTNTTLPLPSASRPHVGYPRGHVPGRDEAHVGVDVPGRSVASTTTELHHAVWDMPTRVSYLRPPSRWESPNGCIHVSPKQFPLPSRSAAGINNCAIRRQLCLRCYTAVTGNGRNNARRCFTSAHTCGLASCFHTPCNALVLALDPNSTKTEHEAQF